MPQDAPNLRPAPDPTPGSRTEAPDFPEPTSSKYLSARSNGPRWDPVNDFLVTHLDSIDERLLEYLDDDDELRLDVVQRLGFYTSALLASSITPDHVVEDWPDWFQLVPAFVATYGTDELQKLEGAAKFLEAIEEDDDVALTEADLAYLKALEAWLDVYPEMRTTE